MEIIRRILFIALVVTAAVELVDQAAAATYVVGDSLGWRVLSAGAPTYENWTSQHVFRVGDVLEFNFATGIHDVAKVTKDSYDACGATSPIFLITEGPANVTLNDTGNQYYLCTFGSHCTLGQRLTVNVIRNSSTGLAPTPPRSALPPTPSGGNSSPPPPRNSAPMVTIGRCNLFVLILASIFVTGFLILS